LSIREREAFLRLLIRETFMQSQSHIFSLPPHTAKSGLVILFSTQISTTTSLHFTIYQVLHSSAGTMHEDDFAATD
jgi:hypothetical protein